MPQRVYHDDLNPYPLLITVVTRFSTFSPSKAYVLELSVLAALPSTESRPSPGVASTGWLWHIGASAFVSPISPFRDTKLTSMVHYSSFLCQFRPVLRRSWRPQDFAALQWLESWYVHFPLALHSAHLHLQ